ncbi:MAG: hypothetical protein FJ090_03830 [Deltaproteobacteria bacterium]|nr:hypothetical protein [Deltaproteobacteria bacterium]
MKLRISHLSRQPRFCGDDDALGAEVWSELDRHLQRGVPRPAVLTIFPEVVQVVDLSPLLIAVPDHHRAVSSFASQNGAEAIALAGVLLRRRAGAVLGRDAVVFIEWSDGRWWWCRRPLGVPGTPVADADDTVERAVEGAAKPMGLGGWFGRARFEQMRIQLDGRPGEVN